MHKELDKQYWLIGRSRSAAAQLHSGRTITTHQDEKSKSDTIKSLIQDNDDQVQKLYITKNNPLEQQ